MQLIKCFTFAFVMLQLIGKNTAIWNGRAANAGLWPWAIQVYPSGCSASMIHTNGWVLSAAHCMGNVPRAGTACRSIINNQQINCEGWSSGNVFFNPGWPTTGWIGPVDAVLFRLTRQFSNMQNFRPNAPPSPDLIFPPNGIVTIAGFGQMSPNVRTDVLRWEQFTRTTSFWSEYSQGRTYATTNPTATTLAGDSGAGYSYRWQLISVHCCSERRLGGTTYGTSLIAQRKWLYSTLGIPFVVSNQTIY